MPADDARRAGSWRWPQGWAAGAAPLDGRVRAWLMTRVVRSFFSLRLDQLGVVHRVVRLQVKFTALDALPLTVVTAVLLGGITLIQVFGQLSTYGAEHYLSQLLAKLVIRELGPLLVGVIVIGRSGTAIAAEWPP